MVYGLKHGMGVDLLVTEEDMVRSPVTGDCQGSVSSDPNRHKHYV